MSDLKGSIKVTFGTTKKDSNRYLDVVLKIKGENIDIERKPGVQALKEANESDKDFALYALEKTYTYLKGVLNEL